MKKALFDNMYGKFDFPVINDGKRLFAAVERDGHYSFHDGQQIHGFGSGSIKSVNDDQRSFEELKVLESASQPETVSEPQDAVPEGQQAGFKKQEDNVPETVSNDPKPDTAETSESLNTGTGQSTPDPASANAAETPQERAKRIADSIR